MRLLLLVLLGLLPGLLRGAGAAEFPAPDRWRQLQAPHYVVLSGLDDARTRAWAAEFDQFIATVGAELRIDPAFLPPLTVVLFASEAEFDPWRPAKPSGEVARNVLGVFHRRETWGVIGLAAARRDGATRATIFHEAVHWLTSARATPLPRWRSEGLAELYSTFRVAGRSARWGDAIPAHLADLRGHGPLPMADFLAAGTSLFDDDGHTGRWYAQAWALAHAAELGGDARARSADPAAADGALRDWLAQPHRLRPASAPAARVPNPPVLSDASAARVHEALARLALGAADVSLAHRHAAALQRLEPDSARSHELRAYLAQHEEDLDAAVAHAQAAVAAGSRDAEMHLVTAAAELPVDEAARARRLAALRTALALNPRSLGGHTLLLDALRASTATSEDIALLAAGRRWQPGNGVLALGLAEQRYRAGDREQARGELARLLREEAAQDGPALDEAQRAYARALLARWRFQDLSEALDVLLEAGRIDAARALLDATPADEDAALAAYVAQMRALLRGAGGDGGDGAIIP